MDEKPVMAGDDETPGLPAGSKTTRLEAFSDGVFAIAITLLVLEISVPAGSDDDLFRAIRDQWHSYLAYLVSFATIGAAWLAHTAITECLERANGGSSHPEVRTANRRDGARRSNHLDARRRVAPKEIKENLSGWTTDPNGGFAGADRNSLVGAGPSHLQADLAQPATEVAATAADVEPQGRLHHGRKGVAGAQAVRSAQIFVVDEELVQVRERADPADAEEPRRRPRPDPREEPPEVAGRRQPRPASLGEPLKRSRKDKARSCDQIALTEHDVGGEVVRGPAFDQGRGASPELLTQLAQCKALLRVQPKITQRGDRSCLDSGEAALLTALMVSAFRWQRDRRRQTPS
jgi:hypothetical protein